MNFKKISHIILLGILFTVSCREDYETSIPSQDLSFSEDEIFLNTVFTDIPSSTYTLTVTNNENKDISIPSIFLEKGASSLYSIEVDGNQNNEEQYDDVLIRNNDFITIYVTITAENSVNSLYEDKIIFNLGNQTQEIKLSSVIENVELFRPDDDNTHYEITSDTTWDNTTSKIIYEGLLVKEGATLTIEKGTKVYFYTDSELVVEGGGELIINGTKDELVNFSGYRTEPQYDTIIGTWNKIGLEENAMAKINYAYIKGGTTALEVIKAEAELTNTQIYNSEQFGLYGENATIMASNLVVNHARRYGVFLNEGGYYDFIQCTLVNYWPYTSNEEVALYVSNTKSENGELTYGNLKANFKNSIIYSPESDGLRMFIDTENAGAILDFDTNLINEISGEINLSGAGFSNTIINQNPLLKEATNFSSNDLQLTVASPALNVGNITVANTVPKDLLDVNRTLSPDLGAYELE
ncbi:hypothetical protein UJ101_00057 [Flavobacteriaceae bacterium UJ101]|nr:hypothetical protein UJ101_00057 [Flavobacteriaceae bacterium UJ101]